MGKIMGAKRSFITKSFNKIEEMDKTIPKGVRRIIIKTERITEITIQITIIRNHRVYDSKSSSYTILEFKMVCGKLTQVSKYFYCQQKNFGSFYNPDEVLNKKIKFSQ